jgi:hypothetical protein
MFETLTVLSSRYSGEKSSGVVVSRPRKIGHPPALMSLDPRPAAGPWLWGWPRRPGCALRDQPRVQLLRDNPRMENGEMSPSHCCISSTSTACRQLGSVQSSDALARNVGRVGEIVGGAVEISSRMISSAARPAGKAVMAPVRRRRSNGCWPSAAACIRAR